VTVPNLLPDVDEKCGKYLTYRDFIECSDTYKIVDTENIPKLFETYEALELLASKILDPVIENFGKIVLTYGISCGELARKITKRISPPLDQHASYERNSRGNLICGRLGAAIDFYSTDVNSLKVAQWIAQNCDFDRMYLYGDTRPLHVSYGPEHNKAIVIMCPSSNPNRLVPRVTSGQKFLSLGSINEFL
jgi:hypothetical protein